jgi:hypothetical protein
MLLQLHGAGAMCTAHGTGLQHVHSHAGVGAWSYRVCFCTQMPAQEREGTHPNSLPLAPFALQQLLTQLPRWQSCPCFAVYVDTSANFPVCSNSVCVPLSSPQAESHLAAQRAAVEEAEAAVQEALRRLQEAEVGGLGGGWGPPWCFAVTMGLWEDQSQVSQGRKGDAWQTGMVLGMPAHRYQNPACAYRLPSLLSVSQVFLAGQWLGTVLTHLYAAAAGSQG